MDGLFPRRCRQNEDTVGPAWTEALSHVARLREGHLQERRDEDVHEGTGALSRQVCPRLRSLVLRSGKDRNRRREYSDVTGFSVRGGWR